MVAVLIGTLWALNGQVPVKERIDSRAILKAFYQRMHDAPTAAGIIRSREGKEENRIVFRIMRPNLFSLKGDDFQVVGDGKTMTMKVRGRRDDIRFRQSATSPDIYGFEALTTDTVPTYVKAGRLALGQFRGQPAYAIPISDERTAGSSAVTLYVGRTSLLPIGCIFNELGKERSLAYEAVELGVTMDRSEFRGPQVKRDPRSPARVPPQ